MAVLLPGIRPGLAGHFIRFRHWLPVNRQFLYIGSALGIHEGDSNNIMGPGAGPWYEEKESKCHGLNSSN